MTVEAAAFHHEPSKAVTREEGPLLLTHVVRAVLDAGDGEPELDAGYISECGVDDRIEGWIDLVRDQIKGTSE